MSWQTTPSQQSAQDLLLSLLPHLPLSALDLNRRLQAGESARRIGEALGQRIAQTWRAQDLDALQEEATQLQTELEHSTAHWQRQREMLEDQVEQLEDEVHAQKTIIAAQQLRLNQLLDHADAG